MTTASRWVLSRVWPFVGAAVLHRAALAAAAAGDEPGAGRLFARAAAAYRRELDVAALARLRVHERMVRARVRGDDALVIEVERGLARLDEIESLDPPFMMLPAHEAMGAWRRGSAADRMHAA